MYRILNRVSERPQTNSDKQHMWLVNRCFTGFFSPFFSHSYAKLTSEMGHALGFAKAFGHSPASGKCHLGNLFLNLCLLKVDKFVLYYKGKNFFRVLPFFPE